MDGFSSSLEEPSHSKASQTVETLGTVATSKCPKDDGNIPPHLSHDPELNQKRTDPFQFGQRYLEKDDNVFEYNAWDHVEPDDAFYEYAEEQYERQRQSPVSEFDKSKCCDLAHNRAQHLFPRRR